MTLSKAIRSGNVITQIALAVIFVWLLSLTYQGSMFGQLGLGSILIVVGIWTIARSQDIWATYLRDWKRLPIARRSVWNKPYRFYYYFNLLLVLPVMIALGIALIYLSSLMYQ